MQLRTLGRTGIKVTPICLGTMTWGQQNTEADAHQQLDYARDRAVTFIDTAEMYPVPPMKETQGRTESYIGSWLKSRGGREKLVLATKVSGRGRGIEIRGTETRLDHAQINQAIDDSLRRLQTDYIDLYQIHWPERHVNTFGKLDYVHDLADDPIPLEETLEFLDQLVKAGKVRAIGLSNDTPWGVMRMLDISRTKNIARVASIQNPYSLLNRSFEVGLAEIAHREDVGLLAYSPLAMGVLTGKYLNDQKPANARLSLFTRFQRYTVPQAKAPTEAYVKLAGDHGLDPGQMALAFITSRPFVTSNIIGATNLAQLASNIDSQSLRLSDEVIASINAIHRNHSNPCP